MFGELRKLKNLRNYSTYKLFSATLENKFFKALAQMLNRKICLGTLIRFQHCESIAKQILTFKKLK
jgi:hypothetical protein